MAQRAAKGAA